VTDAGDTPENRDKISRLAADADHLFVETVFLDRDRALARATAHLTARAAGELARSARARRVTGFHHSARYADEPGALEAELQSAAGVVHRIPSTQAARKPRAPAPTLRRRPLACRPTRESA
jgi:ribonuclease BN (tRNA processing enzyme)